MSQSPPDRPTPSGTQTIPSAPNSHGLAGQPQRSAGSAAAGVNGANGVNGGARNVPARTLPPSTDLLLAQLEALEVEVASLRQQADARTYHLEQVEKELLLAARLQRDFLPKRLPNHGSVRFNRLYRPAGHVSGDLYDIRRLDERHVGVYLADAIGHGMPAALLAMFMHNALQTKRISPDDTAGYRLLTAPEAMRHLNETLCGQDLANATFATAAYAVVDLQSGHVELARGGHPHPLLIRAGEEPVEIGGEGALLGIMPDEIFHPAEITLAPGDRLILFTDGVDVAFVPPGGSGDPQAWRDAIAARAHLGADELLADLWRHLEQRGAVDDDVTVVTLEMVKAQGP